MLRPSDYEHLTAQHWADIAGKLIELKDGEQLILTVSDGHEGGATSSIAEVKNIMLGFAQHASTVVLNGDDYEYQSPAALKKIMDALKEKYSNQRPAEYWQELEKKTEELLEQKAKDDAADIEKLVMGKHDRHIVKVIGNHENFETFRDELDKLEAKHPNFQWSPEMELIPIPGAKQKQSGDTLLAVHGDLQMNDLKFVDDGGSDKERYCYKLNEMAAKAVRIATNPLLPSAEKQNKWQWVVDLFRKPKRTAKELYAQLLYRAQQGAGLTMQRGHLGNTDHDIESLKLTTKKLNKRKAKFERRLKNLEKMEMGNEEREMKTGVYKNSIRTLEGQLKDIDAQVDMISNKAHVFQSGHVELEEKVLHYKTPGDNEAKLFTPEILENITHINYGHTHVSSTGIELNGIKGKVIVSNNASMAEANMKALLNDKGLPSKKFAGKNEVADLRNLGMLLYKVKDGKVESITRVGELIAKNMKTVTALVKAVSKQAASQDTAITSGAINLENIRDSRSFKTSRG